MQFSPLWRSCEARAGLFKCHDGARRKFSPLWSSCEACSSLFLCEKDLRKLFTPTSRSCEVHAGLLNCQEISRKQFSPLWRLVNHIYVRERPEKPPRSCFEGRASLLSVRKELESSFHHYRGLVRHVQACLWAGKT